MNANTTEKKSSNDDDEQSTNTEIFNQKDNLTKREAELPPVPPAMNKEDRQALEAALIEQFKDCEDDNDDDDDDMALYRPR